MIVASLLGPTVGQLLLMAAVHSLKSHGISRSHITSLSSFTGEKLKHRSHRPFRKKPGFSPRKCGSRACTINQHTILF